MVWENLAQDCRFALRGLVKNPLFTAVAVGSLALAIGANTSIFSFVNAILLKRLPVPEPERLVRFAEWDKGKEINSGFAYPFLEELSKRSRFFQGVAGSFPVSAYLTGQGAGEPLQGEVVTGTFFSTLRAKLALGRLLNEDDIAAASGDPVCVLNYATWQQHFAGDQHIVGRTLVLNSHPYRVIGVTERSFNGDKLQPRMDLQLPVSRMGDFMGGFFSGITNAGITWRSPNFSWLQPVARLAPRVTAKRAQDMLQPLANAIRTGFADANSRAAVAKHPSQYRVFDASQGVNSDQSKRNPLLVLMGIVSVILLIASMNVANLLLARGKHREKEFALRLSLGASRLRLARQLLTESLAMGLLGGALGVLFSLWLTRLLLFYFNGDQTGTGGLQIHLEPAVLAFAVSLSLFTAVLFGVAPAWQALGVEVQPNLKQTEGSHSGGRDRASLRKALTVVQLALSLCLLFAAGLLIQTLRHLQTADLGFQPAQVIALSLDPAMGGYKGEAIDRALDGIKARLDSDPAVASASYAVVSPLEGSKISLDVKVPGRNEKTSDQIQASEEANFNMISPGYFKTLGQRLLAGRDFNAHDTRKAPHVAIVNQLFAARYFGSANVLGKRFKQDGADVEIVGVAGNAHYASVRETPMPLVYLPAAQTQNSGYTMLIRARQGTSAAIAEVEGVVRGFDRRLPIVEVRTLQAQIDNGISSERILGILSGLFGGLAMVLCAIGLYGIIAYGVTTRTREIGIRFALGATRGGVARLFIGEGVMLLALGSALGVPAALAASRLLQSLLFGLQAGDLLTLAFVTGLLLLCGVAATSLPVRRAAAVQPLVALRYE